MLINDKIIDDAIRVLSQFGILATGASLSPMRSFSNYVWRVRGNDGDFVLRRYSRLGYKDVCRMNGNLRYLTNRGFRIPSIITSDNKSDAFFYNGYAYDLSEYIEHKPLTYHEMNISFDQLKTVGGTLSKIHQLDFKALPFPVRDKSLEELNPELVLSLVNTFRSSFELITEQASKEALDKLRVLSELIDLTHERREKAANSIRKLLEHLPISLTHGDFSLSNLLPESDDSIAIIDWENMGLRPRIWELHRSLLLICGKGKCNANFDEINFNRATIFIRSYKESIKITRLEWTRIPDVAEYVAFVHWLKFTLESVLSGDLRILERIPDRVDQGLWWLKNLDKYISWVREISS